MNPVVALAAAFAAIALTGTSLAALHDAIASRVRRRARYAEASANAGFGRTPGRTIAAMSDVRFVGATRPWPAGSGGPDRTLVRPRVTQAEAGRVRA